MEQEFVKNQTELNPKDEDEKDEMSQIDELRGDPVEIGTLEEFVDEEHAIISTNNGPNYYVTILSFVDKD